MQILKQELLKIVQINDANSFNIVMRTNATANTTGGWSRYNCNPYEDIGPVTQTIGYGWGTYIWGDSTWGTERSTSSVTLASRKLES